MHVAFGIGELVFRARDHTGHDGETARTRGRSAVERIDLIEPGALGETDLARLCLVAVGR
jgi:hypothetical protein